MTKRAKTAAKVGQIDELVSTKGAAEILGDVSARTVENMIRRGQLESVKMGGRRLIRVSELAAFIRGL